MLYPQVQQEASHGGHNKKLILLTSECFKRLCMRSRTARDAIIKAKTGKTIYKKELIGSLNRFEGCKKIDDLLYLLIVGS